MPLPGGDADKSGNRYESRWTAFCLADVLGERADSIRLEPPGVEGEGAEFVLVRHGVAEYHQVKRQHSGAGRWSLAALEGEHVLSRFWSKLQGTEAHSVFVSMYAADELGELSERARGAKDWDEYRAEFLRARDAKDHFDKLRGYWHNCPEAVAYEGLRRVHVRTLDEATLRETVEYRLQTLVDADLVVVFAVLAQLALDSIHQELRAHDLWRHLEAHGLRRRDWNNDPHVLAAVEAANARYLNPIRDNAVAGAVIPREEVGAILETLRAARGKRHVLISGDAGSGKSGVGLQVVEAVAGLGWPVLALRIDRLETMLSPKDVGRQMDLRDSPVTVLANVAQERECLLLIDQLDAVSKASGRNPQYFDCVGEMIRQAGAHPNMRLALLCRRFDIDNDDRLRRLGGPRGMAVEVTIGRLSHATVRQAVQDFGLDPQRLSTRQLDLLSVPLHLKLLSEVAPSAGRDPLAFTTARELYSHFWEFKQDAISERLGRQVQWTAVLDALCDDMSRRQALSASTDVVDPYRQDARAMASERVLVADGQRYAFFHETFFDYAFARRFTARGGQLLTLLTGGEQHLFRRAQVRQILLHERETDWERYLADLADLLSRPDVRFHLKHVVFALLTQLQSPTEDEWRILAPLLDAQDAVFANEAWRVLSAVPWFRLINGLGVVQKWLGGSEPARLDQAVRYLSFLGREVPDDVTALAEPFVGGANGWRDRLVYLVASSSVEDSRRSVDLILRLISDGTLDNAHLPFEARGGFSLFLHSLPDKRPEWACEVIGCYLERRLALSLERGQSNPFGKDDGTIPDSDPNDDLMRSATGAPAAFMANVLPFMLRVMERGAVREGEPPYPDRAWPWRHFNHHHGMAEAVHSAMEAALRLLAERQPEVFAPCAVLLRQSDCETAQFLLVRAYQANGKHFADEAADYLTERPARLHTGYMDEGCWAARQLLEALTPHCSEERLRALEGIVLDYYSSWEKGAKSYYKGHGTIRGLGQLTLLNGFDAARRSPIVTRRLDEWRRKFRREDNAAPRGMFGGFVGSPIPDAAVEKMTDEQWLGAIAKYDADRDSCEGNGLKGGSHQLSQVLEREVKQNPQRFADFALRLPDDANPAYFDAILRGLGEVNEDVETALKVCRRCHALPGRPCGRWIDGPIRKLGARPLPNELLGIVAWYATEDPDPDVELWRTPASGGVVYYGGDPSDAGINSARGSAALAIAELIFDAPERLAYFLPSVERMVLDPSVAVRSCVVEVLTAMLNVDRDQAVGLFFRLCETDDVLLGTHRVERFLYHAVYTHYERLQPLLMRSLASTLPGVVSSGARLVCMNALLSEDAVPLAHECLSGDEVKRIAAAQVFSANITRASSRSFCEQALVRLFGDSSEKVREEAASCFRHFQDDQLGDYIGLVEAFAGSLASTDTFSPVIHALKETTARLPDTTCLICERFLEAAGADAGDVRSHTGAEANTVGELAVRVYEQSKDAAIQARCLDVIDRMSRLTVYGLNQALSLFDR